MTILKPARKCASASALLKLSLGALTLVVAACDLATVEIPLGEPLVVVHGVMRADRDHQFIVVERSFTGAEETFVGYTIPTEGAPAIPIEGATVRVTNVDFQDDPCGSPILYVEDIGDAAVDTWPGVYWAPADCPTMRPGDQLELYIETPDGEIVTGSTLVTGMDSATLTVQGETVPFGFDSVVTFNKDRDILRVNVEPLSGRLLQVGVFRVGELDIFTGEDIWPGARIHVDTVGVAIPGDLVDAGGWSDGGDVFRAGRDYLMTAALTDVNYFDFSRSGNNKFTGRGFLNRLNGGVGVFGSLAARSLGLRVIGDFDDAREGEYWLRGTIQGIPVDAVLTVFAVRATEDTEVTALLSGAWLKLVTIEEGATAWRPVQTERLRFEGNLEGDHFGLFAFQTSAVGMKRITLNGNRKADASFVLSVSDSTRLSTSPLGTVSATQR